MSRSTLRLALLMVIAIVLVAACNGQGGLPMRPAMATYNFSRSLGARRTAVFRNETTADITVNTAGIANTTGLLPIANTCYTTITPGTTCELSIELTADEIRPGFLRIASGNTDLGLATLIH